eukprot:scaffold12927_cov95-Skeletonema_marinoi.AAC.2
MTGEELGTTVRKFTSSQRDRLFSTGQNSFRLVPKMREDARDERRFRNSKNVNNDKNDTTSNQQRYS